MLGVDVCEFGGQMLELLWLTMCYRGLMTDKRDLPIEEEEYERNLNYNPPAQKTLEEIQEMDKDDESLLRYKQALLGTLPVTADQSALPVQAVRMTVLCDEVPAPFSMDLTGDLQALKEKTFVLKEGVKYNLKIDFKVRWIHEVRERFTVHLDKVSHMMGSYGPKAEEHVFISPASEAPKGLMACGQYVVKSHLLDDDKNIHLSWEWNLAIKKDWD
uniref:Uncharacterized protein n=1 Tax=Mola mola TaxID=94237 RepID=A0A3Q3WVJ5_MOLML